MKVDKLTGCDRGANVVALDLQELESSPLPRRLRSYVRRRDC
jgi:hypothetical protein